MPKHEHRYNPRGNARLLFGDSPLPAMTLVDGPAGTGKSRACLEHLLVTAIRYPGARLAIIRKSHASIRNSARETWERHVVPEAVLDGAVRYFGGGTRELPTYRFRAVKGRQSSVLMIGVNNPERIMSSEFDGVFIQEATELTREDLDLISTRLRGDRVPEPFILADCNPREPTHWLKVMADAGDLRLMPTRHEDNPTLFDDDGAVTERGTRYLARLDRLVGARKARLRHGLWVGVEGAVYPQWDSAVHVIDVMPAGWQSWPRYWAVDFGMAAPTALGCWAKAPDGCLFLYREVVKTSMGGGAFWRHVAPMVAREPAPVTVWTDIDKQGQQAWTDAGGPPVVNADKRGKDDSISLLSERLNLDPVTGRPRLFVLSDSLQGRDSDMEDTFAPQGFKEEVLSYAWATTGAKETPVKGNDHSLDMARYLVAGIDRGASPGIRFLSMSSRAGW